MPPPARRSTRLRPRWFPVWCSWCPSWGRVRPEVRSAAAAATSARARAALAPASDWTTFGHDGLRSGVDPSGNSFSPATPAWTSSTLDGQLYGQPLVFGGRVFAATENDTVYALAADSGQVLWSSHLGTPLDPSTVSGLCGNIHPTVGITGTPVIDPARNEIFVVATEAVTVNGTPSAAHHLIGLDTFTGLVQLDEVIDPPGTSPPFQLQRVSLGLTAGRVVVGLGGNSGDCDPYHGLVVSAPEDGSNPSVFTVANQPGDSQGAVWMGGAAPSIDAQGDVWVATGNSAFHSSSDPYDQSDGVLKLSPTMQLLDAFAPAAWFSDNASTSTWGRAPRPASQRARLRGGQVPDRLRAPPVGPRRCRGPGGVDTRILFLPDGGSADLNGTLFVPCSNGVHAVTVTGGPPPPPGPPPMVRPRARRSWPADRSGPSGAGTSTPSTPPRRGGTDTSPSARRPRPSPRRRPPTAWCWPRRRPRSTPSSARPASRDRRTPIPTNPGYWLVASDGGIFAYGGAGFLRLHRRLT